MAFTAGGGNGGAWRGRRFSGGGSTMSEINVVPLVDVVLVLLIIFMITANVMDFGLDIKVPVVRQVQNSTQDLPVVSITKNAESTLNGKPINIHELGPGIHARFPKATAVYVRADKETPWDPIAQIVAELGDAKYEVKMVTQPLDSGSSGR